MLRTQLVVLILIATSYSLFAQVKAKAISYQLTVDVTKISPEFAQQSGIKETSYEVDTYYSESKLKTVVRSVKVPESFQLTIRRRLYDISSKDEYNVDDSERILVHKKNQEVKIKATGKKKSILGYECKEFTLTDHRGVGMTLWVTDKLDKNICPVGNYSLKGTALEVSTSNGLRYVATDFAQGELDAAFFDVPQGYTTEVIDLSTAKKK